MIKNGNSLGSFFELVRSEHSRAVSNHVSLHSLHEGFAVILEELDELWEQVRKRDGDRNNAAILAELVQIAAMAARTAIDLDLCE